MSQEVAFDVDFEAMDVDGDGVISKEEYMQAFFASLEAQDGPIDPADPFLESFVRAALAEFESYDLDGNGTIEREEYVKVRAELAAVSKDYQDFLSLDADYNGYLSVDELVPLIAKPGMAEVQVHQRKAAVMASIDANGDGRVSLDEYLDYCRSERAQERSAQPTT